MGDPRWRDLGVRAISAVVLGAVGVLAMWSGGIVWTICILLLAAIMGAEWVMLCGRRGALWPAGLLYIGPAAFCLIWLRHGPDGLHRTVFLAAIVWAGDVGAYLAGRLFGGPRLAPRISPGKTWSGAAGGTLCGVSAGLAAWSGHRPAHLVTIVFMALALSLVAQAGDLLESALKRFFGAKDSSHLIPGHGGLLDRMDGVLTAAPLAAWFALMSSP